MRNRLLATCCLLALGAAGQEDEASQPPYLIVLGISQDGGVPQAGAKEHAGWKDPSSRRHVACLGIVDEGSGQRWMIEATPDFPEQLHALEEAAPVEAAPGLNGVLLTHAHIGHYTGLMFLGHEVLGTASVPVYAMPRLLEFLSRNGPWEQLVRYKNIELRRLQDREPVVLSRRLSATPLLVPHRQEYSEVVGFRVRGPTRSALFIPDIDGWEQWDASGVRIEDEIARVDVAYLDGTFYANGEIPGRDMSTFPHPFITHSMERFRSLPPEEKAKVRFIHLNHTNPALWPETDARKTILENGFSVAEEGERFSL